MKKQIVTVIGLAIMSSPALATKARMLALGENINDNIGSLYFSDSRNLFQNAAYINDYKDMVIMEWGSSGSGRASQALPATVTNKTDNDQNPQAEGGFTKSAGNYAYGLYLGAESPYTNEIRSYTRSVNNEGFHQDNQIDAWFGGEGAVKWGVNATYSNSSDHSQSARQNSASVRLGVIADKIEGFANISVANKARAQSLDATGTANGGRDQFTGHQGWEAGATYNAEVLKVFGYVRHADWTSDAQSNSTGGVPVTAYTGKFDGSYWLYIVGVGREHKVSDKATIFTKLQYMNFQREVDPKSGAATKKVNLDDWSAPLTVGLEYDALSWLTLRGSVVQNIIARTDNDYAGQEANISAGTLGKRPSGKFTPANSTNVNAGATLKFGNLSIDGVVGTGNNNANGGIQSTSGTGKAGILSLDNLMTRVAMTYRF